MLLVICGSDEPFHVVTHFICPESPTHSKLWGSFALQRDQRPVIKPLVCSPTWGSRSKLTCATTTTQRRKIRKVL